jgi:hypothetical protein
MAETETAFSTAVKGRNASKRPDVGAKKLL